jgi:AraC-like DNA-binding protein
MSAIEVRLPTRQAVEREWVARLRLADREIERLRAELAEAKEAQAHLLATANAQAGLSLRRLGREVGMSSTEVRRRIGSVVTLGTA